MYVCVCTCTYYVINQYVFVCLESIQLRTCIDHSLFVSAYRSFKIHSGGRYEEVFQRRGAADALDRAGRLRFFRILRKCQRIALRHHVACEGPFVCVYTLVQ